MRVEGVDLGLDPLKVSLSLEAFPTARREFRHLLQGQLPTINDMVNREILTRARAWLSEPVHGAFDDILIIVDQLDRIPQKILNDQGLTNHENLFLDHAGTFRALNCDVLYTIPIELAYSRYRNRPTDVYGFDILTLPAIPVADRQGRDFEPGLRVLREIVERRTTKAGVPLGELFESPDLLAEVLRRSGGHVRGLAGVAYALGRYPEAATRYEEALAVSREIGDRAGETGCLADRARVAAAAGDRDAAAQDFEKAIRILRAIGLDERAERLRDEARERTAEPAVSAEPRS